MGIWEFMDSTAEAVKRNAPDATPVKDAYKNSYNYGAAAVTKIDEAVATPVKNAYKNSYTYGTAVFTKVDQAVRNEALNRLAQRMPDDEAKSKIGMYTSVFAKHAGQYAIEEGWKLIPGGDAFSKILSKTVNDIKHENLTPEKLKELEENAGSPRKYLNSSRKLIDTAEMHGKMGAGSVSKDRLYVVSSADKSPEDVMRVFMMKEFFGNRFLDDLMIRESAREKGKKPE